MNTQPRPAATPSVTHRPPTDLSDSLRAGGALAAEAGNTTLDWLTTALAHEEARRQLFRTPGDEEQMLLMRRPVRTQRAFAFFGMLLGAFPPAAIFWRIFNNELSSLDDAALIFLVAAMNIVCCLVGYAMGSKIGKQINNAERSSWNAMLPMAAMLGILWALVTGAAGGAIFFGIGAIFGAVCAIPVGIAAFLIFTPLHRLLAHGGMIDARHFWPLALGVVAVITMLILRLS